ncbi:GNAT family N-acetyltransferase [Muricauda sp. JGD-17]|uniref:GNAT family N-acetyltransferase n=1 Tax=Flagellimonas ochracea TaxID=2696472 RepID=A0A964T9E2_9FLAO|nr:GNAT family N-acetyltransferase [Allomuricauda ochracea]NAY90680.1 GNAT family N-acetyltransferase [Allomuricauda ochracea]
MIIKKASLSDLRKIVPLFDAYRMFYKQQSNIEDALAFLKARFENQDNVVFLALEGNEPIGFMQLYKTFSSVSLQSFYILNDLYVNPEYRKRGVGEALLNSAKTFCSEQNAKGLALETAKDNPAQHLYERMGWRKDTDFFHYFWKNDQD